MKHAVRINKTSPHLPLRLLGAKKQMHAHIQANISPVKQIVSLTGPVSQKGLTTNKFQPRKHLLSVRVSD